MSATYQIGDFPPKKLDWKRLQPLIGPANGALGDYRGFLKALPNQEILASTLLTSEAVLSCRIEGSRTSLDDVFECEAASNNEDYVGEIEEILNYRDILRDAMSIGKELPLLSERVLKLTHKRLMKGVRGSKKDPGNYRKIQNWIGSKGSKFENATYIPCPAEEIGKRMSVLERYVNATDCPDNLVLLALVHAEFEAIHPFLDGNGRLGRLLVPLFLLDKGLLTSPSFFISEFLLAHQSDYYERLLAVSRDRDWTGWCEFFISGIESQAKSNLAKISAMHDLYNSCKEWIIDNRLSVKAIAALDFFFHQPVFSTKQLERTLDVSRPTVVRLIDKLIEAKFLHKRPSVKDRRSFILLFSKLIEILARR